MGGTNVSYRTGVTYALVTAALYAIQGPFLGEAARQMSAAAFVGVTQLALLLALPFMLVRRKSRDDFKAIFQNRDLYGKLAFLLALGIATMLCLQFGLNGANPIVVAAVLNLSPFWAALIAKYFSGKAIPASPPVFFASFAGAFAGALLIAFSQQQHSMGEVARGMGHATLLLALPLPFLTALNGTLIGEWFSDYEELPTLAANFLLSIVVVVPITIVIALWSGDSGLGKATLLATVLLIIGTVASSAAGRATYQLALTAMRNDNGFVSMFLLLVPAMTAFVTLPLSWFLPDLRFSANIGFFAGLALVGASLLFFSLKARKE